MLGDDSILGIDGAGFGEERFGMVDVAEKAFATGLLDNVGQVVLSREGTSHQIVGVAGV